jgi:hypothetical protein
MSRNTAKGHVFYRDRPRRVVDFSLRFRPLYSKLSQSETFLAEPFGDINDEELPITRMII